METLKIRGGKSLKGTIRAAGVKNAMTKLLVASLLSDKKCVFHNIPNITGISSLGRTDQDIIGLSVKTNSLQDFSSGNCS